MNARTANIVAWVLQGLLAAAFVMAGGTKLLGVAGAEVTFEQIGWDQWFRYVTGLIEVGGVPIRNWDYGAWGPQTMIGCMRYSLNVCLAWISTQMGADRF